MCSKHLLKYRSSHLSSEPSNSWQRWPCSEKASTAPNMKCTCFFSSSSKSNPGWTSVLQLAKKVGRLGSSLLCFNCARKRSGKKSVSGSTLTNQSLPLYSPSSRILSQALKNCLEFLNSVVMPSPVARKSVRINFVSSRAWEGGEPADR